MLYKKEISQTFSKVFTQLSFSSGWDINVFLPATLRWFFSTCQNHNLCYDISSISWYFSMEIYSQQQQQITWKKNHGNRKDWKVETLISRAAKIWENLYHQDVVKHILFQGLKRTSNKMNPTLVETFLHSFWFSFSWCDLFICNCSLEVLFRFCSQNKTEVLTFHLNSLAPLERCGKWIKHN